MILAVHIGNTNITVGAVRGKNIVFQARLRTDATKTSDEYAIDLKMLLAINSVAASEIEGAIIASVVPQVLNQIKTGLKKLFGKPILVVGPGIKTGLNIRIDTRRKPVPIWWLDALLLSAFRSPRLLWSGWVPPPP